METKNKKAQRFQTLTSTVNGSIIETAVRFEITRFANKQLQKLPVDLFRHVQLWIQAIEKDGLLTTRKTKGYHDEPLKGKRRGQRSIRLNRSWRLIYEEKRDSQKMQMICILIVEVNHHDY